MSFSTTRPTSYLPYDRARRPAGPGPDMLQEAGNSAFWGGGAENPYTPIPPLTPVPFPTTPTPPATDVLGAMRQMMEDMETRMEARIQQALAQRSPPSIHPLPTPPRPPAHPTPPPNPPVAENLGAPQARNGPKMARPKIFDGDWGKCRGFIRSIEVYIFVNPWQFPNEATKVLYLLSYVQGKKVDNWKETMTNKVLDWCQTGVHDEQVSGFERIGTSLLEAFGDPNPRDTAVSTLMKLHQGTDVAEEYVMKFNAYKDDTGYNDVALVELFKRGLNASLLSKVYGRRPLPANCREWQEEAIALDQQWREAQAYVQTAAVKPAVRTTTTATPNRWGQYQYQGPLQPQQNQQQQQARPLLPPPQQAARDPNAMDVDRSQRV